MQFITRKLKKRARRISLEKAHAQHRIAHQADYDRINQWLQVFRPTGAISNSDHDYKLWHLDQLLHRFAPKRILECGSGGTSMIFAQHVRSNSGSLLSLDEDEKWAVNTITLLDIKQGEQIEVRQCPKICLGEREPREIKYEAKLEEVFDFVLIDGPSLEVDGTKWKDAINTNVCDLQPEPKVIVVDVRIATAQYLAERYSDRYDVFLSDLIGDKPVEPGYNYFSYFVRNR